MNSTGRRFTALIVASPLLLPGCGSSDNSGKSSSDVGTTAEASLIPAGHADPCKDPLHTKYLDDDLCIDPPPADLAFQLHFGPTDYTNPDDVNPYILAPGGEDVICQNYTTPNATDQYYFEYHARLREGTHHMITYTSQDAPASTPPDGTLGPCNLDPSFAFTLGSQAALGPGGGVLDVPLPGKNAVAPENAGLASKIKANTKAIVEMHYVNTSEEDMLREGWINVLYTPAATVKGIIDPIFFIGGLSMNIPPHTQQAVKVAGCGLSDAQPDQIRILGMTGHSHASTTKFSAYIDRLNGDHDLVYQSYSWSDPINAEFDSVHQNPPLSSKTNDGAVSGLLTIQRGESVSWECDVDNQLDTSLAFANQAYTAEMCNVFGFVTPGLGSPWSCYKP